MDPTSRERIPPPYDDRPFQDKLAKHALQAGREVVEHALTLYHSLRDPATPRWARARIVAALGYFILPLDLMPDFIPAVGFVDDLTALTLALVTVAVYVKPAHREQARAGLERWFGRLRGRDAGRQAPSP